MQYIFDMDGTLIDSMPYFSSAIIKFLKENKIEYPEDVIKIVTPLGFDGAAKYFITLGCEKSVSQIKQELGDSMIDDYKFNIPGKTHVAEAMRKLVSEGHGISVLTASPHLTVDPCLKRLGLFDLFEYVWSCDDFGTTKADMNIYHEAAKRLGTTVENCIFLDDNYNACLTAKKSGMHVYGVYDASSDEYVDDMKSITEKYIYSFEEL